MKTLFLNFFALFIGILQLSAQGNKASILLGRTAISINNDFSVFIKPSGNGSTTEEYKRMNEGTAELPTQLCVLDAGGGKVAFRSREGKYLSATNGGGGACQFTATSISENEKFKVNTAENGAFTIQSVKGNYLTNTSGVLNANGSAELAQKFYFATFALLKAHNRYYVEAKHEYGSTGGRCPTSYYAGTHYSASANKIDATTIWRVEDWGNGKVRFYVNGFYMNVENGECKGDNGGSGSFNLKYLGGGQFAFQQRTGQYLCAATNQQTDNYEKKSGKLVATASAASTWEKFQLLNPDQGMGEGCSNDAFLNNAVLSNNKGDVDKLLSKGAKPSTEQLNTAMAKNPEIASNLLKYGAQPNTTTTDLAIKSKNKGLITEVINKGGKPTLAHFNTMLAEKDYETAELIVQKGGVTPTNTELTKAVTDNDLRAAQIITAKGVKGDVGILNKSISQNNQEMYQHLSAGVQPDASSLKTAQTANNMDIFMNIIQKGVRCSDENIKMAIDKDQMNFAEVSLQNGANANSGLKHAVSRSKKNYMELCLKNGADANLALNYAVKNGDQNFARTLVTTYGANGDKLLGEAVTAKKIEFATIAFVDGKANPNTHLKAMADANNMPFVNLMLDHKGDPNLAMTGVIKHKQAGVLKRLIGMGANVNKAEHLVTIVEHKSLEMTNMMLNAGANPNPGMKPAIKDDSYDIIKALLAKGASPKGHLTTPACSGKNKTVRLLLDYKADPNEGMKCATEQNFVEMTHMLLSAGAKASGYMNIPANKGYTQIVTYLVEFGADPNEGLKSGVEGNQEAVVFFLLDKGAQPKDLVKIAADLGNAKIVSKLCAHGDAPKPGMMPAARKGHVDVAKVLVGLNVDPKPYEYVRAAVDNNRAKMTAYLLDQGADVNHKAENDITLLHIAANNTAAGELVKVLIEKGAEVNAVEKTKGNTPLHIAVHHKAKKSDNNMTSVVALVEAGAGVNNVNWVGKNGKSVRKYARGSKIKRYIADQGGILRAKKALEAGGVGGPEAAGAVVAEEEDDDDEEEEEE
jgi:ankyrin repeat protein